MIAGASHVPAGISKPWTLCLQAPSSISRQWPSQSEDSSPSSTQAATEVTGTGPAARPLSAKQVTRLIFMIAQRQANNPQLASSSYPQPFLTTGQQQRLEQLSWQLHSNLKHCKPRQLANCIWAWAELGYNPPSELLSAAVQQILSSSHSSTSSKDSGASALSDLAAAAGDVSQGHGGKEAADTIATPITPLIPSGRASPPTSREESQSNGGGPSTGLRSQQQQLSAAFLMQNIAKLRCADPSVWAPLLQTALHSLESGAATPTYLTNATWALAKLHQYAPGVLAKAGPTAAGSTPAANAAVASASPLQPPPPPPLSLLQGLLARTSTILLPQKLQQPRSEHHQQELLQQLVSHSRDAAPSCSPKQLSLLAWSLATLRPFLALHQARKSTFSLLGSSRGPNSSSSVEGQLSAAFDAFASAALHQAHTFKPQDISNMLWAFAAVQQPHAALFRALSEQLLAHSHQLNPQQISNTLWAMATLQLPHRDFIAAAVQQLVVMMEGQVAGAGAAAATVSNTGFTPLSPAAWAKEGDLVPRLGQAMDRQGMGLEGPGVDQGDQEFQQPFRPGNGTDSSSLALKHRGNGRDFGARMPGFISRVQHPVLQRKELITALYAFARLDHKSVRLMELVARFVLQPQVDMPAGEQGHMAMQLRMEQQQQWQKKQAAHKKAEQQSRPSLQQQGGVKEDFEQLEQQGEQQQLVLKSPQLQAGDVTNILWSYATLQSYQPSLFSTLADNVHLNLPSYSKTEVATVLWALASERHYHQQLLTATAAAVAGDMASIDGLGLTNVLWAMATLGYKDDVFLKEVGAWVRSHAENFSAGELVRVAWSFSILDQLDLELLDAVFREVGVQAEEKLRENSSSEGAIGEPLLPPLPAAAPGGSSSGSRGARDALGLSSVDYQQLYQVHMTLQDYTFAEGLAPDAVPCLPPLLLFPARWAWQAATQQPGAVQISQAAVAVGQTLRQLGLNPRPEQLVADGSFRVDWALTWLGTPVVVEVQGPWHYTRTLPRRLLGSSRWRLQRLRARGLAVVEVPLHVWGQLEGKMEKQGYIMQLLQAHVLHGK